MLVIDNLLTEIEQNLCGVPIFVCLNVIWLNVPVTIRAEVKKCEQTLLFSVKHQQVIFRTQVGNRKLSLRLVILTCATYHGKYFFDACCLQNTA